MAINIYRLYLQIDFKLAWKIYPGPNLTGFENLSGFEKLLKWN